MLFTKITLPLAALLATATARPYTPTEETELLARFAEADRLASAAGAPNPSYSRATSAPRSLNELRSPSAEILSHLPRDSETSLASYFPPSFDPYNVTSPNPEDSGSGSSTSPDIEEEEEMEEEENIRPTAVLGASNLSPVKREEFQFGATWNRDQIKYNGAYTYSSHYCGEPRGWAAVDTIKDGLKHLYGVEGEPRNSPKSCGRVSCSYGAAIYWCNDADYPISLHSYGNIAEAALFLTSACFKYKGDRNRVGGQVFFKEKFSVIITTNKC